MRATKDVIDAVNRMAAEGRAVIGPGPQICGLAGPPARPLVEGLLEEEFQAEILKLAREQGWRCYHTRDSRKSEKGFQDVVMVRAGVLVFAELKRAGEEPTADQLNWHEDILAVEHAAPGVVMSRIWWPKDWPDIVALLTAKP